MKCPNCEKEIENGSVFCEYCGTRIKKSKKGLWITLGVVCALILTAIVVGVVQEQQREKAKLEQEAKQAEQERLKLEAQLEAERQAAEQAALQAEQARKAAAAAERRAELARQEAARNASTTTSTHQQTRTVPQGYVDLGLPSGTLWKNANEGGDNARYTYDEAVRRFGSKLPTKEQLHELRNKCTWTRTGSGYRVTGPNGKSIFLPAAGFCNYNGNVDFVGTRGFYWSSTPHGSSDAWNLFFFSGIVDMNNFNRSIGQSVRLVQD